jgi:hypothetical protein
VIDDDTLFPLLIAIGIALALMVGTGYLLSWLKHRSSLKAQREVTELEQLFTLEDGRGVSREAQSL